MWALGVGVIGSALIGAGASAAVSYGAQALTGGAGGGGAGNPYGSMSSPGYQTNPDYTKAYGDLSKTGSDILSGNLPSYYAGLGQANSPQFQGLQQNVIGQTNQASAEQAAASGTDRSGVAATAAAGQLSNVLPNMTYNDYMNAQNQKQSLLGLGANIQNQATGYASGVQQNMNGFDQAQFGQNLDLTGKSVDWQKMAAEQSGASSSNLLSGVGGTTGLAKSLTNGIVGGLNGSPANNSFNPNSSDLNNWALDFNNMYASSGE